MLENWLRPIDPQIAQNAKLTEGRFGSRIQRFESELPSLKNTDIALIGIGGQDADLVRESLYPLSFPFGNLKITDLGNLRKEDNSFLIPLLQELLEGQICPILISRDEKYVQAQFTAHHAVLPLVGFARVAQDIAFHPERNELEGYYLHPIFKGKNRLFHFSAIGAQSHFVEDEIFIELENRNFDCIRLGKAKFDLKDTEPFIRDADFVSFHLNALKSAEAPAVEGASPSGFFSEDACQISRYAGMSDKLTSIGFFGFDGELDNAQNQTAQLQAHLIWYFIDGFFNRKRDFPASMDSLVEYIVSFKDYDYPLTFWKSAKTGRWWLQVPIKTKKKQQRHRLIPCSYSDFLEASNGDLPSRLLNAFKRFS